MIDLVAELRQLSSDLVSVSPQSAAIKGKHPQILDAAAHRIAALTAENARLREGIESMCRVMGTMTCADISRHWAMNRLAALLAQPKGGPDA